MKKYNVKNYIRYKEDIKQNMPINKPYSFYTRNELIVKFLPLVETMARKFSTSDQASGILSINDFLLTLITHETSWLISKQFS